MSEVPLYFTPFSYREGPTSGACTGAAEPRSGRAEEGKMLQGLLVNMDTHRS